MKQPIEDEFTHLPLSRQRKFQLRMRQQGRCIICGENAANATHCLFHAIKARERNRAGRKLQRRYWGARSYKIQLSAPLAKAGGRRLNGNRAGIGLERLARPAAKRAAIGFGFL